MMKYFQTGTDPVLNQKSGNLPDKFKVLAFILVVSVFTLFNSGCATLQPQLKKPTLTLSSVKLLPTQGLTQQFILGFRATNPNPSDLKVKGLSYNLSLLGQPVMSGTSTDLPTIPANGAGDISVKASVSLMQGWQVIKKLLANPDQPIRYTLDAKLDIPWWITSIHITESGEIEVANALNP